MSSGLSSEEDVEMVPANFARCLASFAVVTLCFCTHGLAASQCTPEWEVNLGNPGMNDVVYALTMYGAGMSPSLYAGGVFGTAQGSPAAGLARWDGFGWSEVGGGVNNGPVRTLVVHDDGDGTRKLFVGGQFNQAGGLSVNKVASWDGFAWSDLDGGVTGAVVNTMLEFNGDLYIGGLFSNAGAVAATNVARWNGTSWSPVGTGLDGAVTSLEVFDDGTGPILYAGGFFSNGGSFISRFFSGSWTPVGLGMNDAVRSLRTFNDGSGLRLYAGGDFTLAGGAPAPRLARWDGISWEPVGAGMNDTVYTLTLFNDGIDPALYAGGAFTVAGGLPTPRLARWDGLQWNPLATGPAGDVRAMASFNLPAAASSGLAVAGDFTVVDGSAANHIAVWTSCLGAAILFRRGDCNVDGTVNIADAISLLNTLFGGVGPPAQCNDSCDANDDGLTNIADSISLLGGLFGNPPQPLPPPLDCGPDPTLDGSDCLQYTVCP